MIARRSFMASILAAGVAPWVVKAGVLMPVKQIIVPDPLGHYGVLYLWPEPIEDMVRGDKRIVALKNGQPIHASEFYKDPYSWLEDTDRDGLKARKRHALNRIFEVKL